MHGTPPRWVCASRQAEADWAAVQAHVRQVQKTIRGGTPEQARAGITAQGIDLFMGEATFTSPHEIRVNGETLRGERFVIATGTVPFIPDIEGLSEAGYITNVEAVSLPELPKRLVVIGGGPIGLEFAQMFSRFGVQVVVLERGKAALAARRSRAGDGALFAAYRGGYPAGIRRRDALRRNACAVVRPE